MIIGTRGSNLALVQTRKVAELLKEKGFPTTEQIIKTDGDRFTDRPLYQVSTGVGAFVRELDDAMIADGIEIAVHSMKDLPTIRPPELVTAAVLERDSPYDVLLTKEGLTIDELPKNAIIGTSSMRRRAQLLRYRPDLQIEELRGNIDTRLRKLNEGQYDGILLAEAGLERMGWDDIVRVRLPIDEFCPSPNQGTVAVVALAGTPAVEAVSLLNHLSSQIETQTERLVVKDLEGGCTTPIGSYAKFEPNGKKIRVRAEVLSCDGTKSIKVDEKISVENWKAEAEMLGKKLAESGGKMLAEEAICYIQDLKEKKNK
ncbi:hydroxymethylbilane synthase [Methanolapillus millepedarum]|uniref:Probable porphobilinogen deaminase n=1 Tax=Methanolapillus millepedarum TaxID=3028296 RepID=A0AA96V2P3_9EURY|nr:Porphobilinogen deaminase [Methanosarcinaceae archaeon Ac7]